MWSKSSQKRAKIEIAQRLGHRYTQGMSRKYRLGMILASFFFVACSLSPEQAAMVRSVELPDLALTNATYVLNRGEDHPISILAGHIALYDTSHKAEAASITFTQNDAQGNVVLRGSASAANVDLQSYDAQLHGSVTIEKIKEQLFIEADRLQWLHEEEILISEDQTEVVITYEGNKKVRGTGLRVELATSQVSFDEVIEGVVLP